jgi:hypothetical protein
LDMDMKYGLLGTITSGYVLSLHHCETLQLANLVLSGPYGCTDTRLHFWRMDI